MSARVELRNWIEDQISGAETVSLPALADGALLAFMADDHFKTRFLNEHLRNIVYNLAQATLAATRGSHYRTTSGGGITPAGLRAKAKRHPAFLTWYEHSGSRHINLMSMKKYDLLEAARERTERGDHEIKLAKLWRSLAKSMSNTESVADRYTEADINAVWARLR